MASQRHRVDLTPRAKKDLKDLKHGIEKVLAELAKLESDPFCGEALKGPLRETRSLHFSLKGGGQYRAIYVVHEDQSVCIVFLVGPRENIYEEAVKRYKSL